MRRDEIGCVGVCSLRAHVSCVFLPFAYNEEKDSPYTIKLKKTTHIRTPRRISVFLSAYFSGRKDKFNI